ncbi:hypothetical protein [Rhizobium johnstonii]|uniref:hypothetical protein n=1 Tax=Rhizobium johnstonii TaxID=3019933 RepID=UPI003F9C907A
MPVFFTVISIRNRTGIPTRFDLLEPAAAGHPAVTIQPNGRDDLKVELNDVTMIKISADDGSHTHVQKFSVKTEETGQYYYIFSAEIDYEIGTFNGRVACRTEGNG